MGGYGWHVVTPLTPFIFDKDLADVFPGRFVNRKRLDMRPAPVAPRNEIDLTPPSTWGNGKTTAEAVSENSDEGFTEFNNPVIENGACFDMDDREYNSHTTSSEA